MRLRGTKMSNQGHCALLLARVLLAEIPSLSVFHTGLKKKEKNNIKSVFCFPLESTTRTSVILLEGWQDPKYQTQTTWQRRVVVASHSAWL